MKLKKIHYSSAVFVGVAVFVMQIVTGVLQLIIVNRFPDLFPQAVAVSGWQIIVLVPIVAAIVSYLIALAVIYIYNGVAKKYPLSWEIKK